MFIINLIDSFTKVNFGIWNAAVSTAPLLNASFGASSFFYYQPTQQDVIPEDLLSVTKVFISLDHILSDERFKPHNTLFISHGCWRFPTKTGYEASKRGYAWVCVPHGMLEPWSLQQKRLKKLLYFNLLEKRYISRATAIRAVSEPEKENLQKMLGREVHRIANGVPAMHALPDKPGDKIRFLFMARLHHKKGLMPLLHAWINSLLHRQPHLELLIAGPDDGELPALQQLLLQHPHTNIIYLGAVYGSQKEALLQKSHVYVLPSYSEGFPTSVLEAMQWGLLPLISEGCNFPEIFEQNLGIKLSPEPAAIQAALEKALQLSAEERQALSKRNKGFVEAHYTLEAIARQQHSLYQTLLQQYLPPKP